MEGVDLIALILLIGLTHWVGGIAAFGSSLLALPGLVWLLPLRQAVFMLVVLGLLQGLQVFASTWRALDLPHLRRMLLLSAIGLPVGVALREYLPEKPLLCILGFTLIASGLSKLRQERASVSTLLRPSALRGLLVGGGVIHGAFACGGALLVVYAQHALTEKARFRATLSLFWVISNSVLLGQILLTRSIDRGVAFLLLPAVAAVALATVGANAAARRLNQAWFTRFVSLLAIAAGAATFARVFFGA